MWPTLRMIWTILGFSVGIMAILCIGWSGFIAETQFFQSFRFFIGGGIVLSGFVTMVVGHFLARKQARARVPEPEDPDQQGAEQGFFLSDGRYWGILIAVFGILAPFVLPLRAYTVVPVAAASPPPAKPKKTNVVEIAKPVPPPPPPAPVPPATFPVIRLQGIIYREEEPAVIIDSDTYIEGDHIGSAIVSKISRQGVQLKLGSETRMYYLRGEGRIEPK